jgi:hypothetical protein
MNIASLDTEAFIVTTSEQPLRLAYAKLGRLFPFRQQIEHVLTDERSAPFTLSDGFLALLNVFQATFPEILYIALVDAALWAKSDIIGNSCLTFVAFHKASEA